MYEEGSDDVAFNKGHTYDLTVGELEVRFKYKMIDLSGFYRHQFGRSSHFFSLRVGVSYNWGFNSYLESYSVNPEPPHDAQAYYYIRTASYLGFMPQASYDFWFLKNRFNVGGGVQSKVLSRKGKNTARHQYTYRSQLLRTVL